MAKLAVLVVAPREELRVALLDDSELLLILFLFAANMTVVCSIVVIDCEGGWTTQMIIAF